MRRELRSFLSRLRATTDKKITVTIGGCWIVGEDKNKYPTIQSGRKRILLTRISYEIFFKKELGDLFACHHCDTPACVNPTHIFGGTSTANYKDAVGKGRAKPLYGMKKRLTFCGDFGHGY